MIQSSSSTDLAHSNVLLDYGPQPKHLSRTSPEVAWNYMILQETIVDTVVIGS